MSNFVTSQIRTYAPIIVGALIAWLATLGLELDADTQTGLVVALTGVLQAAYYLLARTLESRWPKLGVLLGSSKTPEYEG